ncbi:MAG: MFS transporter [Patescibacteria group bacterium]|jgi:MFS family permease
MRRGVQILLLTDAWWSLAIGLIGPIYAIFVQDIGGDILDASWAYFAFMFSSGVALYLFGKIEDKIKKPQYALTLGYVLLSLGCFSYIFVHDQFTLVITQIILGMGIAVASPIFDAMYGRFVSKGHAASEWGDWEAMGYIVTAIASLIGGYLATLVGFRWLFIIMFAISVLSVITSLFLPAEQVKRRRKSVE